MSTAPTAPPAGRSLAARLGHSIAAVAVLALPAVVVAVAWQPGAAGVVLEGAILGLVVALAHGGRGLGLAIVGLLLLVTPLAILSGTVPLTGACVMALLCVLSGVTALWGLQSVLMLLPLFLAYAVINPVPLFGQPVDRTDTGYLVAMALLFGGGALWAVLLVPVAAKQRTVPTLEPASRADAAAYTVTIAVLCALATFWVLERGLNARGAWLVLTILVVAKLGPRDTMTRSVHRVAGTVAGAVLAGAIAFAVPSPGPQLGVAILTIILSMAARSGPRYWVYAMFLTTSIVLLSSPGDAVTTGETRVLYTVIGAGLVIVTTGLVLGYQHLRATGRLAAPTPQAAAPS